MIRRHIGAAALAALCMFAGTAAGCARQEPAPEGDRRVRVVATLFPQYDFARQIAGDSAQISLILPPGVESHTFEPTPADIIRMHEADLVLYTGPLMEPWVQTVLDGLDKEKGPRVIDLSQGIELDGDGDGHGHAADPHIWTSPVIARRMAASVTEALCAADPGGETLYRERGADYDAQLQALDGELRDVVENGVRREIIFAGRFAFYYFAKEYGLHAEAAFASCGEEAEPSARSVADIIDKVRARRIPAVYYEELADPKVARAVSAETGADMLLLHSCHNVSKEDLEGGATYLSLMRRNARNLKEGLNEWL